MKILEAKALNEAYKIYGGDKDAEFTARHIERRLNEPDAKQARVSTKKALRALVDAGWLKRRPLQAGERVLGYEGFGRPPEAFRLIGKKARSVEKAVQQVLPEQ